MLSYIDSLSSTASSSSNDDSASTAEEIEIFNENSFNIFDEWYNAVSSSSSSSSSSLDRVASMLIRYCRPKEMMIMIMEKLAISSRGSGRDRGRVFMSLMSLLHGVVKMMTLREATAFYQESLSSTSVALGRVIMFNDDNNGNDGDDDGDDDDDDDMIKSSVDIYLSTVSLLTLQTGTVSNDMMTALVTALVDVCSMLAALGCDRRRDLVARVVSSLQSLVPVSVMTDILVLHGDRTTTISTEGAKAIAEVVLPDYIAVEDHHHHHHHLLARVYSKRFMWQVFSSHLLGGVRVDQSGYMFITSLGHILHHHHHHHHDRSRLTVSVMMRAIAEADMHGLYHFNERDGPNVLIVTIVSALMSCADQGTRNEALVVIRFILLMHDERSLLPLLQKLVAVFDQVPSVAALFIDVVKDLVQYATIRKHYSHRLIYDNFISKVLLQVTSSPDDGEWVSDHIDIVSATATLFHAIVLRLVRHEQQNEVIGNTMEVYDDVTTRALNVLKKLTERTNDLRLQLLCFELDGVADELATIKRRLLTLHE